MKHVIHLGNFSHATRALLRIAAELRAVLLKSRSLALAMRRLSISPADRSELRVQQALVQELCRRRVRLRTPGEAEALRQTVSTTLSVVIEAFLLDILPVSQRIYDELQRLLSMVQRTGLLAQRRDVA